MEVNFDLVIGSEDYTVDMQAGLETMHGVSDSTRLISEAILTNKVSTKKTHKSDIRTSLKKTFKGSYGQVFSIETYTKDSTSRLRQIGKDVFAELMAYFLAEAVYQESNELSEKAKKILGELSTPTVNKLLARLREPLKDIHKVNKAFDYPVTIRYRRKVNEPPTVLQKFDSITNEALDAIQTVEIIDIEAAVTRLNINTGNGRIQLPDETQTVAFGFGNTFGSTNFEIKKMFSENLDQNMGIDPEFRTYLKFKASPVKLLDSTIVKYIFIEMIVEDE
ncbi:hypothetical protein C5B72_14160 [Acinetobacter sp. KU 011TH]|uniref:hypothetical protein n=1 Tax=Acinetobacter pittii TaxID=48296 RepID=UPI000F881593|nr:hypothetical protein [Acinetobacter pittii]MBO9528232.1 hypothetical protein [Acinetobacter oleivorans]RSN99311.1 hypothetical protein EA767_03645 [Acinetobacter pittii]TDM61987.1 hypothetical protein C5B72_14160 [Acinetobacter sp. KU 011TH]TDM62151.1 hypothetical protein C4608_14170 [Acinetobacter sp. KU 013TH]